MSWKEPNWAQMSRNKLKLNVFVAHFHKVFRPHPLTPFYLRPNFALNLHNPEKFHEDSSFGIHFRDLQKLV